MTIQKYFRPKSCAGVATMAVILLVSGCVTTHVGNEYRFAEQKLVVSCGEDNRIQHAHVKSIICTIENTGDSWVTTRFSDFRPLTTTEQTPYENLSPGKIKSFITAYNFERSKDQFNTQMILSGLIIGSAIVASTGDYNVSSAMFSAGLGGAVGEGFIAEKQKGMGLQYEYSDEHLLGPPFELPPNSFIRKTILIDAKGNKAEAWPMDIELCLAEPAEECRVLSFLSQRERVRISE